MPYTQTERLIAIHTPLGDDVLLLRGFTAHESMSRLFRFHLDLLSEKSDIEMADVIGQEATVSVKLEDGRKRYFHGYASQFAQAGSTKYFTNYHMEVVPWLWFLTRNADCRIFQNMSVPDILEKIFSKYESSEFENSLTATYEKLEYCVQYRETDFNFVSRLMEQYGISYYFEHEEGKHTLVLSDSNAAYKACPVQDTISYNKAVGDLDSEDVVTAWDVGQEMHTGKYSQNDYNFKTPSQSLLINDPTVTEIGGNSSYEVYDYPGLYLTPAEGRDFARIRMQEVESAHKWFRGSGNCRVFTTGHKFDLQDHYIDDMNDTYLLTEVMHTASAGGSYGEESATAASYSNNFACSLASQAIRPQRITPKPFVQGPQTAMIVGKAGEEVWVDKYGRVKVQFYWDRLGKKDENSSCWIRVSQPWAGQNWGGMWIPRIGQEVIVSFLEGDPDRPVITGRVYNAEQMPPYPLPDSGNISGFKSNSTKGGGGYNEFSFDDTKSKEKATIHAQKDMGTTVEHDDTQTVHNNRTISVDGTHTETIKKDTTITVTEGKEVNTVNKQIEITSQTQYIYLTACTEIKLEVGASKLHMFSDGRIMLTGQNIAIDGALKVRIHSMEIASEADLQHQTKGTIVVSEGSATNTIKGAMVMLNP